MHKTRIQLDTLLHSKPTVNTAHKMSLMKAEYCTIYLCAYEDMHRNPTCRVDTLTRSECIIVIIYLWSVPMICFDKLVGTPMFWFLCISIKRGTKSRQK